MVIPNSSAGNAVASWSELLINFSSHGPNPRGHFERSAVYRIQILCIEAMLDLINVMTLMITVVMYNLESL